VQRRLGVLVQHPDDVVARRQLTVGIEAPSGEG
jgi:hypothetical protein